MQRDMDNPDSRRFACTVQAPTLPGQSCNGVSLLVIGYGDVDKAGVFAFCGSAARKFVAECIAERAR